MVSEELYQQSNNVRAAYVPPIDLTEGSMGMMSQNLNRRERKIILPPIDQTAPGQAVEKARLAAEKIQDLFIRLRAYILILQEYAIQ